MEVLQLQTAEETETYLNWTDKNTGDTANKQKAEDFKEGRRGKSKFPQ